LLRGASDDDDEGISAEGFFGNDDDMAAVPRVLPSAVGTVGRGAGIAFPNGTALSWLAMLGASARFAEVFSVSVVSTRRDHTVVNLAIVRVPCGFNFVAYRPQGVNVKRKKGFCASLLLGGGRHHRAALH
jgi:hypothetical protein